MTIARFGYYNFIKINKTLRSYIMRQISLFIMTIFVVVSSNGQTSSSNNIQPYDYDTTLKGGYTIKFAVDDSLQYLYLKKAGRTIVELAATSRGMLYKNLGYVGADFTKYFVLVHSFGSGNPNYIELIEKSTGKNVLKDGEAWIDANEKKEYLLYSDNGIPDKKDKMTLYNIRTGQKQFFNFPENIFDESDFLNRIQISKLTDKLLIIKYDTEKGSKTKVYSR
jgi:hypothetical protein